MIVKKIRKFKKAKRIRKTEAEMILVQYKKLCLEKPEERRGYISSLHEAKNRVIRIHSIPMALRFLEGIENVIIKQRLQECFPYSQAFFHLKNMVIDKIDEMKKIQDNA